MPQTLDQILLAEGVVDRSRLERAQTEAWRRNTLLVPTLIDLGFVSERSIAEILARACGAPLIDPIPLDDVSAVFERLPAGLARALQAVPLDVDDQTMTLAIVDPTNASGLSTLREMLRLDISFMVGIRSDIERLVDRFYPAMDDEDDISLFNPRAFTLEAGGQPTYEGLRELADVENDASEQVEEAPGAPGSFGTVVVTVVDTSASPDAEQSTARSRAKSMAALSPEQRVESLETRVTQLFRIVASLQTRLEAIEARLGKLSKP